MSLIAIKDLSLTRSETLFAGLNLSIAQGDRLGLVAANGRGKSSLLRIIAGRDDATTGTLTRARGLTVAFAPQTPPCLPRSRPAAAIPSPMLAGSAGWQAWV